MDLLNYTHTSMKGHELTIQNLQFLNHPENKNNPSDIALNSRMLNTAVPHDWKVQN